MRGVLLGRCRGPENLWKTGHKIDFVENLHCFFMSRLFNFLQATLVVYPFERTQPDRTQTRVQLQTARETARLRKPCRASRTSTAGLRSEFCPARISPVTNLSFRQREAFV